MLKSRLATAVLLTVAAFAVVGLTKQWQRDDTDPVTTFPQPSQAFSDLPPPTGLAVTAVTSTSVWLRWDPPADSKPAGYCVKRNDDRNSDWCRPIANSATTVFADAMLEPGMTYVYTVRSLDAQGLESVHSASVTVHTSAKPVMLTPPGRVRHLQVSRMGSSDFSIYWTPPESSGSSNLAGFIIIFDGITYGVGPGIYSQSWPYVPGSRHVVQVIAKNSDGALSEPTSLEIVTPVSQ